MAKKKFTVDKINDDLSNKKDYFMNNLESNMLYKSNYMASIIDFEWLDEIEHACPYLDVIIRNPKLQLIKEEEIVKMERSKRVTVETIKDLAKHTNYINKYDERKREVQPSKVLNVFNEETFNIYENRFLYTLIDCIQRFVDKKEKELKNLDLNDNKLIEYSASTFTKEEKINIEMKITAEDNGENNINDNLKKEIAEVFKRIKRIKEYLSSWCKSGLYLELERKHVHFIQPPVKKTNVILKNPNFQIAVRLWDYLRKYDLEDNENIKDNLNKEKNDLQDLVDHSFLIDFCVLDSICKTKKEQKQKIMDYSVIFLMDEIKKVMDIIKTNGYEVDENELIGMLIKEFKNRGNNRLVGMDDVKNKFKSVMEEYLERTQDYL